MIICEAQEKLIDVLGKDIDLEASRENIGFPELSPGEMLGNVDSNILRRLREGVTRFLIVEPWSGGCGGPGISVPIMFDNLSSPSSGEWNHLNAGSNILFLDGHVEFQRSSDGDFPINGAMGKFIESIANHRTSAKK